MRDVYYYPCRAVLELSLRGERFRLEDILVWKCGMYGIEIVFRDHSHILILEACLPDWVMLNDDDTIHTESIWTYWYHQARVQWLVFKRQMEET